jgi:hypothetical protein
MDLGHTIMEGPINNNIVRILLPFVKSFGLPHTSKGCHDWIKG